MSIHYIHRVKESDLVIHQGGNTYILSLCGTGAFITTRQTTLYEKRRVGKGKHDGVRICAGLGANLHSVNLRGSMYSVRWDCGDLGFISPTCGELVDKLGLCLRMEDM